MDAYLNMENLLVVLGTVLGIIGHVLKKIVQARETDNTFSLKKYLTLYPYRTALMAFYAVGGTAALYWTGTAEFYTALVTGFAANSLSGAADK